MDLPARGWVALRRGSGPARFPPRRCGRGRDATDGHGLLHVTC